MKKLTSLLISYVYLISVDAFANFSVSDPTGGLFDKSTKIVQGVMSAQWIINVSAGLFAIVCFISAGNYARQGTYGRAAGACIGAIIAALGAYLVSIVVK